MNYWKKKEKCNLKILVAKVIIITIVMTISIIPAAFGQETITIDILMVNDFHGALLEEGKNIGAAKLAGFLKTEKEHNPNGTLLLSAGDMFQGTPEANMLYGKPVLEAMNEIGFEAMAIGNHEFDWGIDVLNNLQAKAEFPFLSANISAKNTQTPLRFAKPYVIIEKNGVNVGIIGLTTLESAYKVKPSIVSGFIFEDLAKTVNSLVPVLKKEGAQIIVVLGHIGSSMDKQSFNIAGEAADLANKVQGVDAIVSAHTHLQVAGKVNEIPIVQAGYWGQAVGKISLIYSKKDNKVIESNVNVIPMSSSKIAPNLKVKDIVDNNLKVIEPIKNTKLGVAANELSHSRGDSSILGQWVSDVILKKVKADIAFQNGGGLRANIPQGPITIGSLYKVVPFDNTLVTMEMTGSQIMKVLEHGLYNEKISMLQYSGINVIYDSSLPNGTGQGKAKEKQLLSVTMLNGNKLDLNKTYKVVVNDYMAEGGDGFAIFKKGKNITDTYILERDVLIDAVKSIKVVDFKGDNRFRQQALKPAA